jgi:hypothetical protein
MNSKDKAGSLAIRIITVHDAARYSGLYPTMKTSLSSPYLN